MILSERTEILRCLEYMVRAPVQDEADPVQAAAEHDLLICAVGMPVKTQKSLSCVVFAVQIFIDMRRELGPNLSRGLRELRDTKAWLLRICQDHLDFERSRPVSNWALLSESNSSNYVEVC